MSPAIGIAVGLILCVAFLLALGSDDTHPPALQ